MGLDRPEWYDDLMRSWKVRFVVISAAEPWATDYYATMLGRAFRLDGLVQAEGPVRVYDARDDRWPAEEVLEARDLLEDGAAGGWTVEGGADEGKPGLVAGPEQPIRRDFAIPPGRRARASSCTS